MNCLQAQKEKVIYVLERVQGHKTNSDTFVINYVTPIRDTFTVSININIYLISEIENRICNVQFVFRKSIVLRNPTLIVEFLFFSDSPCK